MRFGSTPGRDRERSDRSPDTKEVDSNVPRKGVLEAMGMADTFVRVVFVERVGEGYLLRVPFREQADLERRTIRLCLGLSMRLGLQYESSPLDNELRGPLARPPSEAAERAGKTMLTNVCSSAKPEETDSVSLNVVLHKKVIPSHDLQS